MSTRIATYKNNGKEAHIEKAEKGWDTHYHENGKHVDTIHHEYPDYMHDDAKSFTGATHSEEGKDWRNLSGYKHKNIQGLYHYDHYEHHSGAYLQKGAHGDGVMQTPGGTRYKFDNSAGLKDIKQKLQTHSLDEKKLSEENITEANISDNKFRINGYIKDTHIMDNDLENHKNYHSKIKPMLKAAGEHFNAAYKDNEKGNFNSRTHEKYKEGKKLFFAATKIHQDYLKSLGPKQSPARTYKLPISDLEEESITEAHKLIGTYSNGNKTAKVYKDNEWSQHIVKHYIDGKHHEPADSFSGGDKEGAQDAHDTAKHWINDGKNWAIKKGHMTHEDTEMNEKLLKIFEACVNETPADIMEHFDSILKDILKVKIQEEKVRVGRAIFDTL